MSSIFELSKRADSLQVGHCACAICSLRRRGHHDVCGMQGGGSTLVAGRASKEDGARVCSVRCTFACGL